MSTVELDAFGRASKVYAPDPSDPFGTALAAELEHVDQSPLSYVDMKRYTGRGDIRTVVLLNAVSEPVLRFSTGDQGAWIVDAWTERDGSGRPSVVRRPFLWSGQDPITVANGAAPVAPPPDNGWFATIRDTFSRVSSVSENGTTIRQQTYGPLSVTVRDAKQLPGAPNDGARTEVRLSGRGLVKAVVQHRLTGGDITTSVTHDGLGHPLVIRRSDSSLILSGYVRTMVWDAFGKLLENNEPNTSQNGNTWRYAYDDANRLAGTSDARGCGKDIYYDGLGRVTAEDFSPCTAGQPAYSAPSGGAGFEVEYAYDDYEAGQVSPDLTFADHPDLAAGKLVAVRDRGAYTRFNYDSLGNVRRIARRVAKPSSAAGPDPYTPHWFAARADFDLLGRLERKTSGADDPHLWDTSGTSQETYSYSARGLVNGISSSYGSLIESITYGPDGLVEHMLYGDGANTEAHLTYDARRRLATYDVTRSAPALWATHNPPDYPQPNWETTPTHLGRFEFRYDAVGNPTRIDDDTDPNQYHRDPIVPIWRRVIDYDDLYRVTRVDHRFNWPAPPEYRPLYGPEVGAGDTRPVPLQIPPTRILEQTFSYDYLGNLTNTWDDQNASYDRSLGDITHGSAIDGPNQIRSAPGVTARHDAAGNLVELKIERSGYCLHPSGSRCAQWFAYDWDEVGQLARARRWDFESTLPPLPSGTLPSQTPSWDLHYGYSMGVRVLKSATDGIGPERHQVDVFDSLRLADAAFDTFWQPEDYQRDRDTMQVFLAGGMARVFYDGTTSLPRAPGQDYRHVYLQIGDHLGSSTAVIELATGELVERTTHTAYGAIESDHRPSRWHEASEPLKFTGKEEDIEVGLTYFGARYYAPRLGRWASADPLTIHGLGSDLNPYAYVGGRVMSHVDPFGLCTVGATTTNGGTTVTTTACPEDGGGQAAASAEMVTYPIGLSTDAVVQQGIQRASDFLAQQRFVQSGLAGVDADRRARSPTSAQPPWDWSLLPSGLWNGFSSSAYPPGSPLWFAMMPFRAADSDNPAYTLGVIGGIAPSLIGPGVFGKFAGRTPGLARARWPNWSFGNTGGALGTTDKFGNITIRSGLSGQTLAETLAHESVHSVLSPAQGGPFSLARANFGQWAYSNSHLVRYVEEALAEGYATGSISKGLAFPLSGYRISPLRLGAEGALYGGIVAGPTIYAVTQE